MITKYYNWSKI